MQVQDSRLLTEREQAKALRVSYHHLVNMQRKRKVLFYQFGKAIRYDPARVAKALEKLEVKEL